MADRDRVIEGTLLGSDYLTVGERAVVRLWITGPEGATAVLDPSFEPYFYAVPDEGIDPDALAAELGGLQAGDARPARCAVVERAEGLEPVRVVQVFARHPRDVPSLREAVRKAPGVGSTREDDVLFANRYLVDHGLVPLVATRASIREDPGLGAPTLVEADQDPAPLPELHLLAFDLEVYNPRVTPNPKADPILVVSLASNRGHRETLVKRDDEDDRRILEAFLGRLAELDPDVLVTYNGDNFDWPYLVDRASVHGLRLPVGRDGSEPTVRQAGRDKMVRITGRANVDAYQMVERDLPDVKVRTLERVAEHLGVLAREDRTNLDSRNMAALWDDPARREEVLAYALDDAVSTLGIAEELLGLQVGLCRRTFQDLTDGSRMGRGRQADWYLLAEAHRRAILAPDKRTGRGGTGEPYEGGVVLEPPAGIHEDVVYLDFSSMYPSIMVAYNVSPDTYLPPGAEAPGEVHEAPGVGHRFRAEPDGFFKRLIGELLDARGTLKREMAGLAQDAPERRRLKVEEQAIKVLTNAFYGYMGWPGARWQSVPCAEATTAWGRHFIGQVADKARTFDMTVLYGDTDSVMVLDHPEIGAFIREVNDELPVELEVEARFDVLFFTGAKKRYAGRTDDGTTLVRGLEVRRGDWCDLAKEVQQEVIDALLEARDPARATEIAKRAVEDVREGRVPLGKLTIHKTLTMDPSAYKGKQPHAIAVEKARELQPDFKPLIGAKLGYVIVAGKESLVSDRARLVDFLDERDVVDADYYIENQLLPAALRVLGYFGVDADELTGRPQQKSLEEWFG